MSGNIVIDWVNNVLEVAENAYEVYSISDKKEMLMEIIGMCDAVFKSLGYPYKYRRIKYARAFNKMIGKDTTVIDWTLEVVDAAVIGEKCNDKSKVNKCLKCIIGTCKIIKTTLVYVYPEEKNEADF